MVPLALALAAVTATLAETVALLVGAVMAMGAVVVPVLVKIHANLIDGALRHRKGDVGLPWAFATGIVDGNAGERAAGAAGLGRERGVEAAVVRVEGGGAIGRRGSICPRRI